MSQLNPTVEAVTARITHRSQSSRRAYLTLMKESAATGSARHALGCTNLAHGLASAPESDKILLRQERLPNLAIVSAYNDMLSAHMPYGRYPDLIKETARQHGATAQVAGGVPAMCDGITQGEPGMELSLFSRDLIAMSTAIALSHNTFDGAMYLGVCDKIVPGLLIGALRFGHLPSIFVPAGPMASGITNHEKAKIRQLFTEGKVGRDELLESEMAAYHSEGTCTFYGTANSNQMLMEIMGLHIPGAAFVPPNGELRDNLTATAVKKVIGMTLANRSYRPISKIVTERSIVNGIIGLLATGGSTNHTIHLIAIAKAAGIQINWEDFNDLSRVIPLIAKIYPNGPADVNQFHAAGGVGTVIGELLSSDLLHQDVTTVCGKGLHRYATEPKLSGETLKWSPSPEPGLAPDIISTVAEPFRKEGGVKLLEGNLGRAVVKVSAVAEENWVVEAPCLTFNDQESVQQAFKDGKLDRDVIVVVRLQGPKANGMPELHKLMPVLGVLQDRGRSVALVTDGRLSGASGKVPCAIHVSPEVLAGGPLGKVRDGDVIRLDCGTGELAAMVDAEEWDSREASESGDAENSFGLGRELFAAFRDKASTAEEGACVFEAEF